MRTTSLGAFPIADNSSYVSTVEETVIVTDTICESLGTSLSAYLSEASSYAATTTVVASKSSSTFQAITSSNSRSDESKTAIPSPATSILYTPQTVTASDPPEPYDSICSTLETSDTTLIHSLYTAQLSQLLSLLSTATSTSATTSSNHGTLI